MARSEAYLEEERAEEALIELQNALALRPQSAEVNVRMGKVLVRMGNHPMAAHHFGQAFVLDPSRVEAALRQVRLLQRLRQPGRARQVLEAALETHSDHAGLHRMLSELALRQRDTEAALAAARSAVELEPESPRSWLQLGFVHRARAEALPEDDAPRAQARQAALEAFAETESRAGGHIGARVETAQLLAAIPGREEEATAAFRNALALCRERRLPRRRYLAARAFEQFARRRGDEERVVEALREQIGAEPERLDAWTRLADASAARGRDAERAVLDQLLAAWPESPGALVTVGAYLAQRGRPDEAIARLEAALEAGRDEPLLLEQLLRIELTTGELEAARARAVELEARHPGHPVSRRAAARIARVEGRFDAALEGLRPDGDSPADPESELLRARIELERGQFASARAALQRVLATGFSEPGKRLDALLRARTQQWPEALAALRELEARGIPLGPDERLIRARAHYARGDAEAGRRELAALLEAERPAAEAVIEYARREGESDPTGARAQLEAALTRNPGRFELLEALTRLDLPAHSDAALQRLDAALASGRAGPRALLLRAELHASEGRLARAEADAMRGLEAAPQLPWAVEVAYAIYRAQGREQEARSALEEAEAAGALHGGARVLLARLHLAAGESERARATYEGVIRDTPGIAAPARNDLAFLLASRGEELAAAQELAVEAQRALPGNPNVSDTLGYVLLRRGHAEAAAEQFRLAIQQSREGNASLPTFHYHLGLAADEEGHPRAAKRQFERALALDPDFPHADDARRQLARPDDRESPPSG